MNFEFSTVTKIVFGNGASQNIGSQVARMGKRALLTTGVPSELSRRLSSFYADAGVQISKLDVTGEPDVELINRGVELARLENCDLVIGLGGGSAIDAGKAIAAIITNPGDVYDYIEVIGRGKPIQYPGTPFIAIPTTAGTGAEVTSNSVLSASIPGAVNQKIKVSLRSPFLLARLAVIDPELTLCLPAGITASTGMDALTQLIEPFVSNRANPVTDALCREGLRNAAGSLRNAFFDGGDLEARTGMSLASLMSGLALANAKLGAVHGFASPIGGSFPAPHGAVCARLLPLVMETNIKALSDRQPGHPALARYTEIAKIFTGDHNAGVHDGVEYVKALEADLRIPTLSTYGIKSDDMGNIVEQAERASSMQGNPIKLSANELFTILESAL
jgi:alcohol dehydrogenase class IV